MARIAEPWKWEARKGWYAWIKGRRVRLCSLDEGKRAAQKRLGELLAQAEANETSAVPLVGEIVVQYLADMKRRREATEVSKQTKADVERRLAGFAEMHGDLPADAIKQHHVMTWLDTRTGWGATSRHDGIGAVKSAFRWALRQGRINIDPLAGMAKPKRKSRRDKIPTAADVGAAFAASLTPELLDLLGFIHQTGCRPKEARTLEAKHLDRAGGRAVLSEHKTAAKTGKDRILYLTPIAAEIAYRLADLRPEGPIFLNARGRPWTHNALGLAMRRIRARAGLGREMVAYSFRHGFATEALAREVPAALVAELMGHADLRMLSTYSHLSDRHDALRDAAAKVREDRQGGESGT